jgi:hypothetical protein
MLKRVYDEDSDIWILSYDGIMVDVRTLPLEIQEEAFERGLIPYIPAKEKNMDGE